MSRLPCSPAVWARFSTLLDGALALPPTEHSSCLEGLTGDDVALKPMLARVLSNAAGLETGYLRERPELAPDGPFEAGAVVGPYRLLSRLGEGGMGVVWRAAREDEGPRRTVALKLPHPELLGGPFRQRFARERDVLAALSHPHIAQLYDAGLSAEGHPYLALELVEGQPINEACAAQHLSLHRRVALVREVLEALTYAHQRLIVHRDIKPNNVLVTAQGGLKLLDFGIAKLLRPTAAEEAGLTQANARLATPAYAAPEQLIDGEITVAADIFSVGVLLFELSTGSRPFATPPLDPDAREAPLASHRADAKAAGMPGEARLARALRGDLDAIIACALTLDPRARYSTAEAFSRDLARWRDGLPVAARHVGWATLGLKFARRNKVGVALAAVLALALVGGAAGIAWQAHAAALAAARAEHEAARANAVKNYLIGLFEQTNPRGGGKPAETMTAKELLDRGTERVDAAFAGEPETEIELLNALGDIYAELEDPQHSLHVRARRLDLARTLYGPGDPRVITGTFDLADNKTSFFDAAGARDLLNSIRMPILTTYGAESREWARWLVVWAWTLRSVHGGRDEGLADLRQAVSIYQAHFPTEHYYAYALNYLSGYEYNAEQYEAALTTLQQEDTSADALGVSDTISKLQIMLQKGNILRRLGRYDEAQKILEQTQAMAEKVVGRQGGMYLGPIATRALMENELGKREQAMALFGQGMEVAVGKGANTGFATNVGRNYGAALTADGDAAAAIPLLEEALHQTQLHLKDEYSVRVTQGYLGDAYDQAGRTQEARTLLQSSRDEWVRYGVPAGPLTLGARERWARFLLDHGDPSAAATELDALLKIAGDTPSAPAALAQADLANIALSQGDPAGADRLSAQAMQTIDAVKLGYDIRARTDVWLTRAEALLANGKKPEATDLVTRAFAAAHESEAPASARLARVSAIMQKMR